MPKSLQSEYPPPHIEFVWVADEAVLKKINKNQNIPLKGLSHEMYLAFDDLYG
jgi:hypothetical protein